MLYFYDKISIFILVKGKNWINLPQKVKVWINFPPLSNRILVFYTPLSHRAEYPVMARLARKYLTVLGTSTPPERVISRLGIVWSKSRQAMSGPMFSKIMFLTDVFWYIVWECPKSERYCICKSQWYCFCKLLQNIDLSL